MKKNFFYQSFWQILTMILPLITSPILSRELGPSGVGIYAYLAAIEGYFSIVADMGIYRYGIRKIASAKDDKEEMSKLFWEIWFLHSLIFLGIGLAYIYFSLRVSAYPRYMLMFAPMFLGDYLKINWLFTGVEDFKNITVIDSGIKVLSFVAICVFIRTNDDLWKYILIMSLSSVISSLIYWVLVHKYIVFIKIYPRDALRHLRGVIILFIPVIMENIYTSMDKVMLGSMSGTMQVGFYDNAAKALIANRVICAISLVTMPRMSNMAQIGDKDGVVRLMERCVEISIILSSVLAFGTAAISYPFSVLFWGEDFSVCAKLISVLVISMPAMALSRIIREAYLISTNQDGKYMITSFIGVVINMAVNLIFIPYMGAMGAAISTVIAEYAVLIAQIVIVKNDLKIFRMFLKNFYYYVIGIVMYIVIGFVGINEYKNEIVILFIQICLGAMIYIGGCMILWKKKKEQYYLNILRNIVNKKYK